jgi:hypothetical protein
MLFTVHVKSGEHTYVSQHAAVDIREAIPVLLASGAFQQFASAHIPTSVSRPFQVEDVFLVVPMEGLHNAWLAQGGRDGEYFSAVIVRTHE